MAVFLEIVQPVFHLTHTYIDAVRGLFLRKEEKCVRDKIVLVSEAGHGIGRWFVLQFSDLGAKLGYKSGEYRIYSKYRDTRTP